MNRNWEEIERLLEVLKTKYNSHRIKQLINLYNDINQLEISIQRYKGKAHPHAERDFVVRDSKSEYHDSHLKNKRELATLQELNAADIETLNDSMLDIKTLQYIQYMLYLFQREPNAEEEKVHAHSLMREMRSFQLEILNREVMQKNIVKMQEHVKQMDDKEWYKNFKSELDNLHAYTFEEIQQLMKFNGIINIYADPNEQYIKDKLLVIAKLQYIQFLIKKKYYSAMEKRGQIRSLMVQIVSDELQITNFNFHLKTVDKNVKERLNRFQHWLKDKKWDKIQDKLSFVLNNPTNANVDITKGIYTILYHEYIDVMKEIKLLYELIERLSQLKLETFDEVGGAGIVIIFDDDVVDLPYDEDDGIEVVGDDDMSASVSYDDATNKTPEFFVSPEDDDGGAGAVGDDDMLALMSYDDDVVDLPDDEDDGGDGDDNYVDVIMPKLYDDDIPSVSDDDADLLGLVPDDESVLSEPDDESVLPEPYIENYDDMPGLVPDDEDDGVDDGAGDGGAGAVSEADAEYLRQSRAFRPISFDESTRKGGGYPRSIWV